MIGDGALEDARTEIERAAARPDRGEVGVAWLWGDLAQALAHRERYDDAIDAMSRALEAGWDGKPDGRCDIAAFLTRAGRLEEASALWAQVKNDTPRDVWLYNVAGLSHASVGMHEAVVDWLADGVRLGLELGDPEEIVGQMSAQRRASLRALGRAPDELEGRAGAFLAEQRERQRPRFQAESLDEERLAAPSRAATVSLTWFPAGEYESALRRWPDLREEWGGVRMRTTARSFNGTCCASSARGCRCAP